MNELLYKMRSKFLTWFGNLTIVPSLHHFPILSHNVPYKVTGDDVLQIMEIIQPGDVLLRGYDKYVDGKFIHDEKGYSHAGLYAGNNDVIHAVSPCVERTSIIDFCQCDRVMVLRPAITESNFAVEKAESMIGVPYDFNYESDVGRLYCFELIAICHPDAHMETFDVKKIFGLIKRKCYLAKSIYGNGFFSIIYERNDKQ